MRPPRDAVGRSSSRQRYKDASSRLVEPERKSETPLPSAPSLAEERLPPATPYLECMAGWRKAGSVAAGELSQQMTGSLRRLCARQHCSAVIDPPRPRIPWRDLAKDPRHPDNRGYPDRKFRLRAQSGAEGVSLSLEDKNKKIKRKCRAQKPGKSSREASRLGDVGPVRNEPLPGLAPETRDVAMQHPGSFVSACSRLGYQLRCNSPMH